MPTTEELEDAYDYGERPCLTPAQIERLAILAEELGEAQQAIGKILRHGFFSSNPLVENGPQNYESLERELGDVEFAINLLVKAHDIREWYIHESRDEKAKKIKPYLHHQGD